MKQQILKVRMADGKTYIISNTNTNFCMVLENNVVGIGVHDPDVYTDTKRQLKDSNPESLSSLEAHLKEELKNNPNSYENKDLGKMLKAISELIQEKRTG